MVDDGKTDVWKSDCDLDEPSIIWIGILIFGILFENKENLAFWAQFKWYAMISLYNQKQRVLVFLCLRQFHGSSTLLRRSPWQSCPFGIYYIILPVIYVFITLPFRYPSLCFLCVFTTGFLRWIDLLKSVFRITSWCAMSSVTFAVTIVCQRRSFAVQGLSSVSRSNAFASAPNSENSCRSRMRFATRTYHDFIWTLTD
jgi:hypothetical protein